MTADSNNMASHREMASSTTLSRHDRHRSLITTIMIQTTRKWTRQAIRLLDQANGLGEQSVGDVEGTGQNNSLEADHTSARVDG